MRPRACHLVLAASLLAPGCDEEKPAASGEAKAAGEAKADAAKNTDPPAGLDGDADMEITGAVETALSGKIVSCGATHIEGRLQGGSWSVRTEDLDLSIIALTDEELDDPKAVVNVRKPERKSYVLVPGGKVSTAKDRTVAELDADMRNIVAKDDRIHVTGKLTCPPK